MRFVPVAGVVIAMAVASMEPHALQVPGPSQPGVLWYKQAAAQWDHALPLGNGRLGAMVFGSVNRERIQLNEHSLWLGGPRDRENPDAL